MLPFAWISTYPVIPLNVRPFAPSLSYLYPSILSIPYASTKDTHIAVHTGGGDLGPQVFIFECSTAQSVSQDPRYICVLSTTPKPDFRLPYWLDSEREILISTIPAGPAHAIGRTHRNQFSQKLPLTPVPRATKPIFYYSNKMGAGNLGRWEWEYHVVMPRQSDVPIRLEYK